MLLILTNFTTCQISQPFTRLVKVLLQDGLKSTFNKKFDFKPEMEGTAEIITEDLRVVERIFSQFRKIFQ